MQQRVYECRRCRMNSDDDLKLLMRPTINGESDRECACMQIDNILNIIVS